MQKLCPYDLLVFDIDGVLLDVTHSFPLVINNAVKMTLQKLNLSSSQLPYGEKEEYFLKLHGGFNDDWDIALFLCNLALKKAKTSAACRHHNPSLEEIKEAVKDHFFPTEAWLAKKFGDTINRDDFRAMCDWLYCNEEDGAYKTEVNLINRSLDDFAVPIAIYTGRYGKEYELALETLGWQDLPRSHAVTADDDITKPNPKGLEILASRFGAKHIAFFGDTGSDRQCLEAYGKGDFFAIGNLLKSCPNHFENVRDAIEHVLGK